MAIRITHIRLTNGIRDHEHISHVSWVVVDSNEVGSGTRADVVTWIDNSNGIAYVGSGQDQVRVATVHPAGRAAYLRTHADGEWNNNLLALPAF